MKLNRLIIAAIAAVAVIGCSRSKVSETTVLTGSFTESVPSAVLVRVPSLKIDTSITVVNGQFKTEVPTDLLSLGTVQADRAVVHFVPDGTPLNFVFSDKNAVITSKYPKASAQVAYADLRDGINGLGTKYQGMLDSLSVGMTREQSDSLLEVLSGQYENEIIDKSMAAFNANKKNIVSAIALDNLQNMLPATSIDSLIKEVDPAVAEIPSVVKLKKGIDAKLATVEGKKFVDFEVNGQKFSDYIGKGKYVLVDFWASWCGPCRAESPTVKAVYDKYAGEKFNVLSVAVWDKPEDTAKAAEELGITWDQIVDAQKVPTDLYGIQGIPHIILFGPDGTILKRDLRGEAIEAEVAKYVQPVK